MPPTNKYLQLQFSKTKSKHTSKSFRTFFLLKPVRIKIEFEVPYANIKNNVRLATTHPIISEPSKIHQDKSSINPRSCMQEKSSTPKYKYQVKRT